MNVLSRRGLSSLAALGMLVVVAVAARQLAHAGLASGSLRLVMFFFTLLCPLLLGWAIGVWGGDRAGVWGARGVGAVYLGVVGWAWMQDGAFPVGFHLEGFQTPLFVTVVNMGIFVITMYFMQALGRSGGHLGARLVTRRSASPDRLSIEPRLPERSPAVPNVPGVEQSLLP